MNYQKITLVKEPRLQFTEQAMKSFIARLKDPAKSFHGRISQRIAYMKSSGGNVPTDYIRTKSNASEYYYPFGLKWNEENTMDFDSCLRLLGGFDLKVEAMDPLGLGDMSDLDCFDDERERYRLESFADYASNRKKPLKPNIYKSRFYINPTYPDDAVEKERQKLINPMTPKMNHYDVTEYAFSVLSRCKKPAFEKYIFVKQFEPSKIEVKLSAESIMINAKHDERLDEHGYVTRTFSRIIPIPPEIDPNSILPVIDRIGCLKILGRERKAASCEESCKDMDELKLKLQERPHYIHDEPDESILHYRNNKSRFYSGFMRFTSDNLPLTPEECADILSEIDEDFCLENSDRPPLPKKAKTRAFAEAEKILESMHPQIVRCLKYAGTDVTHSKNPLKYHVERAACLERILYNRKKIFEVTSYVVTREEFFVDPFVLEKFQKCFSDISKYVKIYLAYRFEIAYIMKNDLMGDLEFLKESLSTEKIRHLNYRSDTSVDSSDVDEIIEASSSSPRRVFGLGPRTPPFSPPPRLGGPRTPPGDGPFTTSSDSEIDSFSGTIAIEPESWQTNSLSRASDIVPDTSEFTTLNDRFDGNICRTPPGLTPSSTSGDESDSSNGPSDFLKESKLEKLHLGSYRRYYIGPRTPPGEGPDVTGSSCDVSELSDIEYLSGQPNFPNESKPEEVVKTLNTSTMDNNPSVATVQHTASSGDEAKSHENILSGEPKDDDLDDDRQSSDHSPTDEQHSAQCELM